MKLCTFEVYLRMSFEVLKCIYFWLCWVFTAVRAFSLVAASGGHSLVGVLELLIAERGF